MAKEWLDHKTTLEEAAVKGEKEFNETLQSVGPAMAKPDAPDENLGPSDECMPCGFFGLVCDSTERCCMAEKGHTCKKFAKKEDPGHTCCMCGKPLPWRGDYCPWPIRAKMPCRVCAAAKKWQTCCPKCWNNMQEDRNKILNSLNKYKAKDELREGAS